MDAQKPADRSHFRREIGSASASVMGLPPKRLNKRRGQASIAHKFLGVDMPLVDPETLPYRPCAGIVLLNAEGLVWIGRRFDELVQHEVMKRWQMPQGGIDEH